MRFDRTSYDLPLRASTPRVIKGLVLRLELLELLELLKARETALDPQLKV